MNPPTLKPVKLGPEQVRHVRYKKPRSDLMEMHKAAKGLPRVAHTSSRNPREYLEP